MQELSVPRILIDCRWLGHAGPGRVTELLLRGLAEIPTDARWVLWGPEEVREHAWPGAEVAVETRRPNALKGQAGWLSIPDCDLAVFMHQQRPLRNLPAITVVHDTIPLRFARSAADRWLKRRFLKRVVRTSAQVVTFSDHSRSSIVGDLGADEARICVLGLPVHKPQADRLRRMREETPRDDSALFVGRFLPHKNLLRLVEAFAHTDFCARGGRLVLAGGTATEASELFDSLGEHHRSVVEIHPRCSQAELETLFARSLFLVQPSIEEGFGLPVWEALSCGMPVCASDGGSLPEITFGQVAHFSPVSVPAMAKAIDSCADQAAGWSQAQADTLAELVKKSAPDVEAFARDFYGLMMRSLPKG